MFDVINMYIDTVYIQLNHAKKKLYGMLLGPEIETKMDT